MNPSRLVLLVVAGCCVLGAQWVRADAPPFTPDKQFSAEQVMTTKSGPTMTSKIFMSDGKVRSEMSMQGMQMVSIMRTDLKKMYSVMPAQKMVMVMNLDDKMAAQVKAAAGDEGKFETIGPEAVDGVACTKYKMTTKEGQAFFWWVNAADKTPVKMAAADDSFVLLWKNYKAGPQDASLFEPPKDYQVMEMPTAPGASGAPGGQ